MHSMKSHSCEYKWSYLLPQRLPLQLSSAKALPHMLKSVLKANDSKYLKCAVMIHFPGKLFTVLANELIKEGTEVLRMQKERHSCNMKIPSSQISDSTESLFVFSMRGFILWLY